MPSFVTRKSKLFSNANHGYMHIRQECPRRCKVALTLLRRPRKRLTVARGVLPRKALTASMKGEPGDVGEATSARKEGADVELPALISRLPGVRPAPASSSSASDCLYTSRIDRNVSTATSSSETVNKMARLWGSKLCRCGLKLAEALTSIPFGNFRKASFRASSIKIDHLTILSGKRKVEPSR
jgi:hypothetical protein